MSLRDKFNSKIANRFSKSNGIKFYDEEENTIEKVIQNSLVQNGHSH
jgi:hypothetical protein